MGFSPPVLKLLDSRANKANWRNIWAPEKIFFKKIPSELLSFLSYNCHSFRITVIPSVLLSFLQNYCHSFLIVVIPSELLSFLPNHCHFKYLSSWIAPKGEKIGRQSRPYLRVTKSSCLFSVKKVYEKLDWLQIHLVLKLVCKTILLNFDWFCWICWSMKISHRV